MTAQARSVDAGQHLLDLQVYDREGMPIGRVDDVEISEPRGRAKPELRALLVGMPAFANRFPPRIARMFHAIHRRLHDQTRPGQLRIPFSQVRHMDSHIDLSVPISELAVGRFERWAAQTVIGRIPGANHAPE